MYCRGVPIERQKRIQDDVMTGSGFYTPEEAKESIAELRLEELI